MPKIGKLATHTQELNRLARRYGIELIILFGSRARGDARPESDLDVGVLFAPNRIPSARQMSALEARVLDLLQDDVHLVPLNFVNPELRLAAAREGQVLYRRGDAVWTRFVVQNLHLLHDACRLRQYDNDLIERFLEKRPNDEDLQRRRSAPPHRRTHAKPRAA